MQGFNIRANDKGSVIYHNEKPLVLCKGLFCRLVGHQFKIEGASKETLRELVRIAYQASCDPKLPVIDMVNRLGENHCFKVHRGYIYDSIALFEKGLNEL